MAVPSCGRSEETIRERADWLRARLAKATRLTVEPEAPERPGPHMTGDWRRRVLGRKTRPSSAERWMPGKSSATVPS